MKKKIVIESRVEDWDFVTLDANDYERIGKDVSIKEVAKDLGCSTKLLETIKGSLDYLRECIHEDLADLYNKIEE